MCTGSRTCARLRFGRYLPCRRPTLAQVATAASRLLSCLWALNKHFSKVVRIACSREAVLVQIPCSGILENSRTRSKRVEQVYVSDSGTCTLSLSELSHVPLSDVLVQRVLTSFASFPGYSCTSVTGAADGRGGGSERRGCGGSAGQSSSGRPAHRATQARRRSHETVNSRDAGRNSRAGRTCGGGGGVDCSFGRGEEACTSVVAGALASCAPAFGLVLQLAQSRPRTRVRLRVQHLLRRRRAQLARRAALVCDGRAVIIHDLYNHAHHEPPPTAVPFRLCCPWIDKAEWKRLVPPI